MKKVNNLKSKILATGLAIALGTQGCLDTPRYTSECVQMEPKVTMCFTKYAENKYYDCLLYITGDGGKNVINPDGDTLPSYVYYFGPTLSEIISIDNKDSLETFVNNTLKIKQVVVKARDIKGDTTLKTRSKYKPIISKLFIDVNKKYKDYKEFTGYHSSKKYKK